VAELADAPDSKSGGRKAVWVRFPPRAFIFISTAVVKTVAHPMKRRDFLKDLAAASGTLLYGSATPSHLLSSIAAAQTNKSEQPVPLAIRGLIENNGRTWQPIRLPVLRPADGATATIRVDGAEFARQTIPPGAKTIDVLTDAVASPHSVSVTLEVGGDSTTWPVTLHPVRKVTIYVLPHSHNDIGYTDIQTNVEAKQIQNLRTAIELARKTADYPEGARFVWNLEGMWAPDLFMQRASESDKTAIREAVQKGWIALNGMYANTLTGLCRPEELIQLFRRATELAAQFDVKLDSAMISDVPGFTWGTTTAMAQAGIRYFSVAPNWFDRIGSLMQVWQDKPFWLLSPSGKEKLLVWIPWTGYAMSHLLDQADEKWVSDYQQRLDDVNFPYDISYIRWSGHGDNAVPDPQIVDFLKNWNSKYSWPKFRISSTTAAFSAFEDRHGKEIPGYRGDLTPYWEDGAGSSALETAMNRNTADRILQAAALFAMRTCSGDAAYPAAAFADAWRNVLLYSEHTWGAWNSVSDSENKFVTDQWNIKRSFAVKADKQSRELVNRALALSEGRDYSAAPEPGFTIDVFNTTSWPRTELVSLPKEISRAGGAAKTADGRPIPSQRLSTGELAIWVSEIPPFATQRYMIAQGAPQIPAVPVTVKDNVLENSILHIQVDEKTGGITEFRHHSSDHNFVDTSGAEQLNTFLYLPGDKLQDLQTNGPVTIIAEDSGPLVATLRIESAAPGCNKLVRKIRLVAGADHIEISNLVDKRRAPLNPNPGNSDQAGAWAQHGGKESLQFAFPFNVKDGQVRIDIPLGVMRPELDQLPGACKNWLPVGRWIDVANDRTGITWVTLDAPLVEIGAISANLLGSQHNPDIWRKHIDPTQRIYSWVMNNHWGTNYRAYQEGPVEFRYALRPHTGYDPAAAARFATGLSQALLPTLTPNDTPVQMPFLRVEPSDVLVTSLKLSDDGNAWIVRLFGASGEDRVARLVWSSPGPPATWLSNTSENRGARAGESVHVAGWDLVTLRAERA
jgi:alpha-mannosidase